jgi:hypothetical protein
MMTRGTVILVLAALATAAGAYQMRPQALPVAQFEDTGEPLFASFTDPTLATYLEVVHWDEATAQAIRFSVEQKEGRWVIPSHNDYPADGTERMGKAAASFIGVNKDMYYGDNPSEHGAFGVLDPTGAEGKGDEKGKRVTIKDGGGTEFVDVIVGKAIPDKQGYYYLRYPEEKRVYGSKLQLDISTSFTDWIEKDLLHVERDEVVRLMVDPYKVDETQGKVVGSNPILADLRGGDEWVAAAETKLPKGKALDSMKVRQIVTAIDNIKIVGVRPRPQPLTLPALQDKGFFVTPDGRRLFGNEGEARIVTRDGLVYTLYFGEIARGSGLALTAGLSEGEAAEEPGEDEGAANRYMFVDVHYEPSLDTALEAAGDDAGEEQDEDAFDSPEDEQKKLAGRERAEKLRQRFDAWFYVIADSSFKQIRKDPDELFKDASPDG